MKNTTAAALSFQNQVVKALAKDDYTRQDLEAVRALLRDQETLRLVRYTSGGASAVTPLFHANDPYFCLESAIGGMLIQMWDRDSIFQAVGELFASLDPALGEGLKIAADAYRRGLLASLTHHTRYQHKFIDIIQGRKTGFDEDARPDVRYNPMEFYATDDHWPDAQNDALALVQWLMFYLLNRGHLKWDDTDLQPMGEQYAALLHHYFWTVCLWVDFERGAWEDYWAEHASSIGVALVSLREQKKFMEGLGRHIDYRADNRSFQTTVDGVEQLAEKCLTKLKEVLPNEFLRSREAGVRTVDSALVNALFIAELSGTPLIDDAMTVTIIDNIERDLMGDIGISRYPKDVWSGRERQPGVPSAQWTHPHAMISAIFGMIYRRTGEENYRRRQLFHFNRSLATVNERFHLPEAYIAKCDGPKWVWHSDANESLAWTQAMLIVAFAEMKASIEHKAKLLASTKETAPAAETADGKSVAVSEGSATAVTIPPAATAAVQVQ